MNVQDRIDRMIESWLMDGPNRLPEAAVDRIVAEIERADTRKPDWLPGRKTMNRLVLSFGGVAILLLAVVGAAYYFGPGDGFGSGTAYSSARHGYSLRIPDTWSVTEIPGSWPPGTAFDYMGPGSDKFVNPAEPSIERFMNSQPVGAGTTFEQWVNQYVAIHEPLFDNCRELGSEDTGMGGEPAKIMTFDCSGTSSGPGDAAAVLVMHSERGYNFRVLTDGTPDERALLLDWLSTLRFTEVTAAP